MMILKKPYVNFKFYLCLFKIGSIFALKKCDSYRVQSPGPYRLKQKNILYWP